MSLQQPAINENNIPSQMGANRQNWAHIHMTIYVVRGHNSNKQPTINENNITKSDDHVSLTVIIRLNRERPN